MNYRHEYHAGNFADVFKHALLVALLGALARKPAPFCYLDTHAGAGRYRLDSPEAEATGEQRDGIGRLPPRASAPAALAPYLDALAASGCAPPDYPGSPLLAATLLRPVDRLVLCELAEGPAAALARLFRDDPRVAVHRRDGYAALKALLPPRERRGLVLVDPPYEAQEAEYRAIEAALEPAFARFATGVYAVWYPIKRRHAVNPFHRWLAAAGRPRVFVAELLLSPPESAATLNGCGLAVVNTPFGFDAEAEAILAALLPLLGRGASSRTECRWLRRD